MKGEVLEEYLAWKADSDEIDRYWQLRIARSHASIDVFGATEVRRALLGLAEERRLNNRQLQLLYLLRMRARSLKVTTEKEKRLDATRELSTELIDRAELWAKEHEADDIHALTAIVMAVARFAGRHADPAHSPETVWSMFTSPTMRGAFLEALENERYEQARDKSGL